MSGGVFAGDPGVSRREFDMLAGQLGALSARIDRLDATGTRGTVAAVGVVQVQLADLAKDLGAVTGRLDSHERDHQATARQADRDRTARARYRLTSAIAGVSALGGIYGMLLYLAAHLH